MKKLNENLSTEKGKIADDPLLGTVDEFHSRECFDLYIYAVKFANQINNYINNGDLVFDGEEYFKNKFVFYGSDKPYVAEKSGNCSFIYFGSTYDKDGKVWLKVEETKSTIKKRFSQFKFVKPCNIERVQFNCA